MSGLSYSYASVVSELQDYDNDGDLDILVNGFGILNSQVVSFFNVYRNNGNGFSEPIINNTTIGWNPSSVTWNDYDNDGDLDLVAKGVDSANNALIRIYTNIGNGSYSSTPYTSLSVTPCTLLIDDLIVQEGDSATFTVRLEGDNTQPVVVSYSTGNKTASAGLDYELTSGTLTFNPREKTKIITVKTLKDLLTESNETFSINLTTTNGGVLFLNTNGQGLGTIADILPPAISINDIIVTEGDSGTKNATFTVTRTGTATNTITIDYTTTDGTAIAGSDYTPTSGTLTFDPNETTKTITVSIIGDTTIESNETFFINLSNATEATITDAQGSGTIINYSLPSLEISDVIITEGNGGTKNATFTVTRTGTATNTITVDYTTAPHYIIANNRRATDGQDYITTSGTLSFATNETTKTITVAILGDTTSEEDEVFFVNLTNATNAIIDKSQGLGTISNDDINIVPSDQLLEVLAKNIIYQSWNAGQDLTSELARLGYSSYQYKIDKVWGDSDGGFYGIGLTSIYNNSAPILVIRGTQQSIDWLSNVYPDGIGFDQFNDYRTKKDQSNSVTVYDWLQSKSSIGGSLYDPYITGHSLGGALSQWVGSYFTDQFADRYLNKIVTFNSPGIAKSAYGLYGTSKFRKDHVQQAVTHYITSSDPVSLAGEDYLSGIYVLADYDDSYEQDNNDAFGVHLRPVLQAWTGTSLPNGLRFGVSTSDVLSSGGFSYTYDLDFAKFKAAIAFTIPVAGAFAAANLSFRYTTEKMRSPIFSTLSDLRNLGEYTTTLASAAFKMVVDGLVKGGKEAINAMNQWKEDQWEPFVNTTKEFATQGEEKIREYATFLGNNLKSSADWTINEWDKIKDETINLIDPVINTISDGYNNVRDGIIDTGNNIGNGIQNQYLSQFTKVRLL